MPGGMPYQLEKGPYFSVTESMLDFGGSAAQRLVLLSQMIADTDPNQLPPLDSTNLDAGPLNNVGARRNHMNTHWFGWTPGTRQQPALDINHPTSTGWWRNWYGDAEGIVAETFIRAVEVSLGLDHVPPGTPASNVLNLATSRCWPIEVFWRCPAPWFEGWVTWRGTAGGPGHVTVHLHTPGHAGSALLLGPRRPAPYNTYPEYQDDPVQCDADRGMWVIAHERQDPLPFYGTINASPPGFLSLPTFGPFFHSNGVVVTVQTSEVDGGVLGASRAYTP